MKSFLDELAWRGLLYQRTAGDPLEEHLAVPGRIGYCGFDPTADSLHVGSLQGLVALRRFADAGHRPLVLAGGATGMIGDPTGRSDERNLLSDADLAANVAAIKAQISRILGPGDDWELVDNAEWTSPVSFLEFLRDVGRHVTINQMLAKESVRARLESESGISYTEFSYMLLQANDYWWLNSHRGCELQVGGSDQWGNITAGIDLVRRRSGASVHGLTWPLLLRSDGSKFGKSASGENVWLDPVRTSPYRFFQYWLQAADEDVERLLLRLTLLSVAEISTIMAEHVSNPAARAAQRRLAQEVTTIVHGSDAARAAEEAGVLLFGGTPTDLSVEACEAVAGEVPTARLTSAEALGSSFFALLVASGLAKSAREAHRTSEQGGLYVNGARRDGAEVLGESDLMHGRYVLLRRGRKSNALIIVGG